MKKIILLLVALFSFSFFSGAQSLDNYLDGLERIRVEEGAFSQEYMSAIKEFCNVLEKAEMTNTYEYYASLYSLLILTNYYRDDQQTLQIAPKLEPLIFVFSETPNEDAYIYARTMINASFNTGLFEDGLYYCKEASELIPNSMDDNSKHKEKADILALEAKIYYMIQNKMEAKRCFDECKDELRYVHGYEQDILMQIQLLDLEGLLTDEYAEAIRIFDAVVNLYTRLINEFQTSYEDSVEESIFEPIIKAYKVQEAAVLLSKGMIQFNNGDINDAYDSFLLSSSISEAIHDTINQIYIACQINIASCLLYFDDATREINKQYRLKEIVSDYYGNDNILYAGCLRNISVYSYKVGDYETALMYALDALSIIESSIGKENNQYCNMLICIGSIYYGKQQYEKACDVFAEVLSNQYLTHVSIVDRINLLSNLSCAMCALGREGYLDYFEEAAMLVDSVFGEQSFEKARLLANIGSAAMPWSRSQEFIEAMEIMHFLGFTNNLIYLQSLLFYGWTTMFYDDNMVDDYILMVNKVIEDYYYAHLSILTTTERNSILMSLINQTIIIIMNARAEKNSGLSFYEYFRLYEALAQTGIKDFKKHFEFSFFNYERDKKLDNDFMMKYVWGKAVDIKKLSTNEDFDKSRDKSLFNFFLFSKSLMLRASDGFRKAVFNTGNQNLINQYNEIQVLRRSIDNQSFDFMMVNQFPKKIYETMSLIERDLMSGMKELGYSVNDSVKYNDVRKALKDSEIAIEFVDYFHLKDQKTYYVALVAKSSWGNPVYVQLCTEDELKNCIGNPNVTYTTDDLYRLLWQPLAEYINEGDKVYFSPSGMLHTIALESLHTPDGSCLNDKYNLVRMTSTRELCKERQPKTYETGAVYGGLQYDVDQQRMTEVAAMNKAASEESPVFALRGEDRGNWNYLKGTKDEAEHIASIMRQANIGCELYEGDLGNEESFKALSGSNTDIIHLATHGYFIEGEKADMNDFMRSLSPLARQKTDSIIDPLLRSGLILSGGNRAWLGQEVPEGIEDGVLTALEISTMNLSGTDMVIMSACETGLGDITSDGVFGLQRAFKMAGVQTLVMSLWKVDDNATSLMMQTFYEHLLSGMSKREAFNLAQAAVKANYPEPYYWAGFVMLD